MNLILAVILAGLCCMAARAEDWTVSGKDYHNVKVGKVETDRVHITYDGGIGTVMISDLPPDLQKRFSYDPAAAKAATQKQESDQAAAIQSFAAADRARSQAQAQSDAEAQNEDAVATLYVKWDADISHAQGNLKAMLQDKLAELKRAIESVSGSIDQKQKLVEAVRTHNVFIGMTRDFVILSFGSPTRINSSTTTKGVHDQLVYETGNVYLFNGVVDSFDTASATPSHIEPSNETIQSAGGG